MKNKKHLWSVPVVAALPKVPAEPSCPYLYPILYPRKKAGTRDLHPGSRAAARYLISGELDALPVDMLVAHVGIEVT